MTRKTSHHHTNISVRSLVNVALLVQDLLDVQFLRTTELRHWCSLNTKRPEFLEQIPQSLFDLVDKCLTVNPRCRITAEEALMHSFFTPCHESLRKQRLLRIAAGSESWSQTQWQALRTPMFPFTTQQQLFLYSKWLRACILCLYHCVPKLCTNLLTQLINDNSKFYCTQNLFFHSYRARTICLNQQCFSWSSTKPWLCMIPWNLKKPRETIVYGLQILFPKPQSQTLRVYISFMNDKCGLRVQIMY